MMSKEKVKPPSKSSNDIIAGNGRILKVFKFFVWLYLFQKILFDIFNQQNKTGYRHGHKYTTKTTSIFVNYHWQNP